MKNIKTYTDALNESKKQVDLAYQLLNAAQNGSTDAVKDLLDRGAKVDCLDGFGRTPLHLAAHQGHTDTAELLLDRGADPNLVSGNGYTPLQSIAKRGSTDMATLLLDRGADVNASTRTDVAPLQIAASAGNADMVRLLLDRGAEVDPVDLDGRTPLYNATQRWIKHKDVAKLLVLHGANVLDVFNNLGEFLSFFDGNLDWMPEGPLKVKLLRMLRGRQAFGM
jgi:ankyrin repeat protein